MQDSLLLIWMPWFAAAALVLLGVFLVRSWRQVGKLRQDLAASQWRLEEESKNLEEELSRRQVVEDDLRASHRHLRNLARQLLSIQEDERGRIAGRIHDEFGQALTAMKLDLAWLEPRISLEQEAARSRWTAMLALVEGTIHKARQIATELKPRVLDELGLQATIEWLLRDLQDRSDLSCTFTCNLVAGDRFLPDLEITLFRVLQELLANVVRHAEANRILVSLDEARGRLVLTVSDDGRGLAPQAPTAEASFGLLQMKERVRYWGGSVEITSSPGGGTAVEIDLPAERV